MILKREGIIALRLERLEDAQILFKLQRPTGAIYMAGYAVECILKALFIAKTASAERQSLLKTIKSDYGHNFWLLRKGLATRNIVPPKNVLKELSLVSSWTPELRYEPGFGNPEDARRFLKSVQIIFDWANHRM